LRKSKHIVTVVTISIEQFQKGKNRNSEVIVYQNMLVFCNVAHFLGLQFSMN